MRRLLWAIPVILVVVIVGFLATRPGGGEVLRSDKKHDTSPEVSAAETEQLVAGDTAFAFDLYQALRENDGNLFFSPHSISVALAMTYAGARGETERQMADTLHFTLAQARLHPAFNALALELAARGRSGLELHVANAIWGQSGERFLPEFLDTLAVNYDAGLRLVDFERQPERSRSIINRWASRQTKGKIRDLVPRDLVIRETVVILTNAIYFDGKWHSKFKAEDTQPGPFTLLDGSQVSVDMMSQTAELGYAEGGGYQAVELPYRGRELSMVVLLPSEGGFRELEDALDAQRVQTIVGDLAPTRLHLTMPKFEYESSFRLKAALSGMGMPNAFGGADFSGIDGRHDLFVLDVVHKALVAVHEEGTIAAAATAVIGARGRPSRGMEVRIDRPFIFLIRDIESGAVLFVGRVLDPRG